jgi:hypothetical protein
MMGCSQVKAKYGQEPERRCENYTLNDPPAKASTFKKGDLESRFAAYNLEFERCYRDAVWISKTLKDTDVKARFRVDPMGKVSDGCIVDDKTHDRLLLNCVLEVLGRMSMPAPHGGKPVAVDWVFHFKVGDVDEHS